MNNDDIINDEEDSFDLPLTPKHIIIYAGITVALVYGLYYLSYPGASKLFLP